jgi:hypothetical protein
MLLIFSLLVKQAKENKCFSKSHSQKNKTTTKALDASIHPRHSLQENQVLAVHFLSRPRGLR